jgi:hypothetical protein
VRDCGEGRSEQRSHLFWVSEFLKADGSSDCKYGRKLDMVEHTVGISRSSVGKRNVGDPFTPSSRRLRKDHATAPPFRHKRLQLVLSGSQ